MMETPADQYQTIQQQVSTEYKDRGSRFLAFAYPVATVDDCKTMLKQLKTDHPKANHHCFAYRLGTDKNLYRSSDDGEPANTAGKPILGQIDNRQLTNVLVVVVRYFGGTLLGVPGLIQAYKTSASLVLQLVPVVRKSVMVEYELQFNYTVINEVMIILKNSGAEMGSRQQELFYRLQVFVPARTASETETRLKDIVGLELQRR